MASLTDIIVGTVLGALSGLGVGGGSLLILWLTAFRGEDPATARNMNLLFFLPGALIACLLRKKKGQLEPKPLLPAIIAGCLAAAVFSLIAKETELSHMRKLFGILLLYTGIRELRYQPGSQRRRNAR